MKSNEARDLAAGIIKHFEGFRQSPYLCQASVPTIGWGQTFYESGKRVTLKDRPITQERADALLLLEIDRIIGQLEAKYLEEELPPNKMATIIQFCYNLGLGKFQASTLRKVINSGDWDRVPKELMKWNKAAGKVVKGLVRRRTAEVQLWMADE